MLFVVDFSTHYTKTGIRPNGLKHKHRGKKYTCPDLKYPAPEFNRFDITTK